MFIKSFIHLETLISNKNLILLLQNLSKRKKGYYHLKSVVVIKPHPEPESYNISQSPHLSGVCMARLHESETVVQQSETIQRRQRAITYGRHQLRQHRRRVTCAVIAHLGVENMGEYVI